MWQEWIVGFCVLCAIGFILWRYLPIGKKKAAACDACNGCSDKKACHDNKQ
jgi:hypothetical protein